MERRIETARRRAVKAGTPTVETKSEPHWTDDVDAVLTEYERLKPSMSEEQRAEFEPLVANLRAPIQINPETADLWQTLTSIDERFDDPEMIQRVLYTGRKDAKGAPKTAARIAWEARVEDPDRAAGVKWRDVEAKIAGRYYRALQGA